MPSSDTDQFIAIAADHRTREDAGLERLPAAAWPSAQLPLSEGDAGWIETSPPPVPAWDELLCEYRDRADPYLRNVAPEPTPRRTVRPIQGFDWRLETAADRADFAEVLAGGGAWEPVSIPHYGPPTGRATAFYRHVFEADDALMDRPSVAACFDGVDYVAEVYLNGRLVVRHEGFFAPFEAELRPYLVSGRNVLVVAVHNDGIHRGHGQWESPNGEKIYAATGPGWDEAGAGWHHCPPGMGIYQPVRIEGRDALHVSDLFVRTLPDRRSVEVRVEVTHRDTAMDRLGSNAPCTLELSIDGGNFHAPGVLAATRRPVRDAGPNANEYRFTFPIPDARLWSPDEPWLYRLTAKVYAGDAETSSDERAIDFGVRTFVQDLDPPEGEPKGRFLLNGAEVRLRGANTMGHEQQAVMAGDDELLIKDLLIAKAANMNFLRITQRPVQRRVYEMADRLGVMLQTDLPLFGYLRRPQVCEAVRQAAEMEKLVRRHPCVVQCSYINEPFPTPEDPETGEATRQLTRKELEAAFVAMTQLVRQLNPDRVVKPMDGDYHPPGPGQPDQHCYTLWYNGHGLPFHELYAGRWQATKPGWMLACGEFGAEGLDSPDLMRRRYPADWLPDARDPDAWTPWSIVRSQSPKMQPMFYPRPRGIDAWSEASRAWQAEAVRLMTEALRRIDRINSTALHLLIDAWPAGWMKAVVDCERRPKPGFWSCRAALEPVHAHATLGRKSYEAGEALAAAVWLCNDTPDDLEQVELAYAVKLDGGVIASGTASVGVAAMRSAAVGGLRVELPEADAMGHGAVVVRRLVEGRCVAETRETFTLWPVEATDEEADDLDTGLRPLEIDAQGQPLSPTQRAAIADRLASGGDVVVFALPEGTHDLPGGSVTIAPFSLEGAVFVEPEPDHPATAGLPADACFAWHHPDSGPYAELCRTVIKPSPQAKWTPILRSVGGAFWDGQYFDAFAAAERRVGEGRLTLCQIPLDRFLPTNPAARRLAAGLTRSRSEIAL